MSNARVNVKWVAIKVLTKPCRKANVDWISAENKLTSKYCSSQIFSITCQQMGSDETHSIWFRERSPTAWHPREFGITKTCLLSVLQPLFGFLQNCLSAILLNGFVDTCKVRLNIKLCCFPLLAPLPFVKFRLWVSEGGSFKENFMPPFAR